MNSVKAELVYSIPAIVGEGAIWDGDNQCLLWVDILGHKIHAFNPANGADTGYDMGQDIGTVVTTTCGLWAYADENGIGFLNPQTGERTQGAKPEKDHPEIRFNDGKCDPRGNFWAGTMAYDCTTGAGKLYGFDANGNVTIKIEGTTISNGLVWNGDHTKFYFIDSATYQIHQYDYDMQTGNIRNKKVAATIAKETGLPDGMAIDSEDHLWVALFDGGKVVRINPQTGETVFEVCVPVPKVTSCAFGGKKLDELYITTANYLMDEEALKKYPLSGSLFRAKLPYKGVAPFKMKIFL